MLCINSGATLDDPNRFKFEGSGYYIKSAEEMRELFKDHPDACDNTLEIAERCNVIFDDHEDGAFMPQFDCPEGGTRPRCSSRRSRRAWRSATTATRRWRCSSRPTTNAASSARCSSAATSSSSPTTSTGRRSTA